VSKGEIMKIENFALELSSQHMKSSSVVTTFERELISQNNKRVKETEIINNELEFCKRLEYEMIQQLIFALQSRTYQIKEISIEEFQSWNINIKEEVYEREKLDLQMSGWIETSTKKIEINMNISFSSTFVQKHQLLKTQFYDPIVLSFDGELPDLDTQNFTFDIDCDGESEQISLLQSGSGFLALDKNNNGCIDDGVELFGALNGNGFYDLKRYDRDGNSWIDENDPIFENLRIWIKSAKEDRLVALGDLGIGALYLGFNSNSFDIKSPENDTLGRIRSNGLYLNEDGSAGLMSQIDFARRNQNSFQDKKENNLTSLLENI